MKIRLERWECVCARFHQPGSSIFWLWRFLVFLGGFLGGFFSSAERWFKPWLGSRIHFDGAHLEVQTYSLFTRTLRYDGERQAWSERRFSGDGSQPFARGRTSFLYQHSNTQPRSKFIVIGFLCNFSICVWTSYTQTLPQSLAAESGPACRCRSYKAKTCKGGGEKK